MDRLRCKGCGRTVLPPPSPVDTSRLYCARCGSQLVRAADPGHAYRALLLAALAGGGLYLYTSIDWPRLLNW